METFEAVQAEIKRRAEKSPGQKPKVYPYTGIIVCAKCGKNFRRKITRGTAFWICSTYKTFGKEKCSSRQIPETAIDEIVAEITDSPKSIIKITADDDNKLTFHFKDGVIVTRTWKGRSRSEAWTEEMREKARQKALKGGRCNGTDNCNPCNKE